jgi:ribosomal protein S18 acetylase RimI-like enzyme
MAEVVVRACGLGDAEAVESLRVAGWRAAYRGIIPDAFLDSLGLDTERRRQVMAGRPASGVESVAVHAGTIVGWVAAGPCCDDDRDGPRHGEIYACYVLPEWWGKGIGRRLLTRATRALARAGRADITLWVLEDNTAARGFYESCGFAPDGSRQILDFGEPVAEVRYRSQISMAIPS